MEEFFKGKNAMFIKCPLCNNPFVHNSGTSILISHLQRKQASIPPAVKRQSNKTANLCSNQSELSQKRKNERISKACSHTVEHKIRRISSKWRWLDKTPIAIIHDKGLKQLLNFLEQNYQFPPTTRVSAVIQKDFESHTCKCGCDDD